MIYIFLVGIEVIRKISGLFLTQPRYAIDLLERGFMKD